jgi:hypothetical protein
VSAVAPPIFVPELLDGNPHLVTITYSKASGTLTVSVAGKVITANVNLSTLLNLDNGSAFVGFTGATGSDNEIGTISNWTWTRP